MSEENQVSNWTKFKILLWKDFKLGLAQKCDLIMTVIMAVLVFALLIVGRYYIRPLYNDTFYYKPDAIGDFPKSLSHIKDLEKKLLYSPKTKFYEEIVQAASEKLDIDQYEGFKDENDVYMEMLKKNYFAGIKFTSDNTKENSDKFAFELRFPATIRSTIFGMQNWNTDKLSPNLNGEAYIDDGFVQLQNALVMSYLEKVGKSKDNLPTIKVNKFPQVIQNTDYLQYILELFPIIFLYCYIYPITSLTTQVAQERETQIKEIMIIIGLRNWLHWCAWFVKSFIIFAIISILMVIFLRIGLVRNGPIFLKSDAFALLFFLLAYCMSAIVFCFATAVCFKKSNYVVLFACLLIIIPPLAIIPLLEKCIYKIILCLIPHCAFIYGMKFILKMEKYIIGLQWRHFFRVYEENNVGPLICLLMFIVDTIIYFLFCLYMEQINTGEYGISKKWYFPFERCLRKWNRKHEDSDRESGGANHHEGLFTENLTKKFGDYYAVNNLSFVMHSNQITVMLGRNGAGKSTTILMLTGLLKPTSGTAYIDGYNISTDLSEARQSIGLCPQQNALFDNLSVRDHIIFFSRIKGIKGSAAIKEQIVKYTEIMELDNKKTTLAKDLSGGMKRKLCLCCALCGHSKVVLCDEPSSGVDPAARRRLWSLLQSEKYGKAILLTTHFMDEAEALADQIVVLREGELKYQGTIFDMKKRFGQGYCLICDMDENCSEQQVTKFLEKHMPNITLESQRGSVLIYRLPPGEIKKYVDLFRNLENNLQYLNLSGFGINISTVEEVFTQLAAEHNENTTDNDDLQNYDVFSNDLLIDTPSGRQCQRLKGLFYKRMLKLKKNWYCWLFVIILPALILLLAYAFSHYIEGKDLPALPIDIKQYDKGETMLELFEMEKTKPNVKPYADAYEAYAKSFGSSYIFKSTNGKPFDTFITDSMIENPDRNITEILLIGATIKENEMLAWHNPLYPHAIPLSVNYLHNAIARVQIGSNAMVSVTNAPLPLDKEQKESLRVNYYITMMLLILIALFVCYPVQERGNGVKLQQYLAGVNCFHYWFTIYLVDFIILMLMILGMILVCICIRDENYNTLDTCLLFLVIFTLFALDILLWIYLLSFIFKKPGFAFGITIVINYSVSLIGNILVMTNLEKTNTFLYCIRLIPIICLDTSLKNLNANNEMKKRCKRLQEQFENDYCSIEPNCCPIPNKLSLTKYGIGTELIYFIFSWILLAVILFLFESQIGMWLSSYFSWCKCSQLKKPKKKKKKKRLSAGDHNRNRNQNNDNDDKDDDVALEEERVQLLTKSEARDLPLVIDRISKQYGRFQAVSRLSLFVQEGECFGLLGVNGAGKTTTFKMLTGSAWINKGNAYIHGHSLKTYLKRPNSKIGYCPQSDSLILNFTGREHLYIYGQLNGVRSSEIERLSNVLASRMDFTQHMDKRAKNLSGGNKRKLCTAIALLGNPEVIFLDEPSSGMDPLARRQLWYLVIQLGESGKPIVLTSHSMEECEALCTRLGIMVAGRLRCLGSTQHLKNKFSKGFILKISMVNTKMQEDQQQSKDSSSSMDSSFSESTSNNVTSSDENLSYRTKAKINKDNVKDYMNRTLPQAELTEEYDYNLTYHVPKNIIKYSEIFQLLEKHRKQLKIDDYAISQTTLDDIFIGFSTEEEK